MTARKTLRELRAQHDNLPSPALPNRPDWSSTDDRDGLERWKRYLAYEESNPLEIDDAQAVHQRIGFAYRKALANLRFYPEIWCVIGLPPFSSLFFAYVLPILAGISPPPSTSALVSSTTATSSSATA